MDAIEAMRVALGSGVLLSYVLRDCSIPPGRSEKYTGASTMPFTLVRRLWFHSRIYPDLGELGEGQNIFDRHQGLFHPARKVREV